MATGTARLMVMLSGGGRTLVNLADSIARGDLPAKVVRVVVSRECPGADRARGLGIPVTVEAGEIPAERLLELAADADWIVLAGYLRRVAVPPELAGRIVNIHPALLPKFGGEGMYGMRVHHAVLKAGETQTGCSVHLCDAEYDQGPVVLQGMCPVMPGDTAETLAARVFEVECRTYPRALRMLIEGWADQEPRSGIGR